jgi:hypothetical protein
MVPDSDDWRKAWQTFRAQAQIVKKFAADWMKTGQLIEGYYKSLSRDLRITPDMLRKVVRHSDETVCAVVRTVEETPDGEFVKTSREAVEKACMTHERRIEAIGWLDSQSNSEMDATTKTTERSRINTGQLDHVLAGGGDLADRLEPLLSLIFISA